jgi:hypothetical protein
VTLYRAQNVDEAVALATAFKRDETYDWFRGQISNWLLKSSFVRLRPEQQDEALQKLGRFESWGKNTLGLEALASHPDAVIAVAQHYGLPTNFIDFTTEPEVAGFFASYGSAKEGMDSCIICLNTADLDDFWKNWFRGNPQYPPPEFLHLDVPNLWRLEAQSGTFLYCPYDNFEFIYDLDRILFPYTGLVSKPAVEQMYPQRKSGLEILLDQYFMNERLIEGTGRVKSMTSLTVHRLDPLTEKCDPDLILGGSLPKHCSWDADKLLLWLATKHEKYSTAVTEESWQVVIDLSKSSELIGQEVSDYVRSRLLGGSDVRNKLVSWSFQYLGNPPASFPQISALTKPVQRLWDGLRALPYDNEDLAIGIGNCVALCLCELRVVARSDDPWMDAASLCFGKAMEVEFGSEDGSYSRSYVSSLDLLKAVRDDIAGFLTPTYREAVLGNMTGLLQAVQAPDRLFSFDLLAKLFARQLAPAQVLVRPSHAIFFSPARLDSFGLP